MESRSRSVCDYRRHLWAVTNLYICSTCSIGSYRGIVIGASIRAGSGPYETWAAGAAGFAVGFGLLFLVTQFVFQINWMDTIHQGIEDSFSTSENFMRTMEVDLDEETLELAKEQAKSLVYLIPTFMMVISIVFALIAQWVSYRWINRTEKHLTGFQSFVT